MIIIEKIPWSFIKFSQLILKGDVWRSVWRICMSILGLKGLKAIGSCFHLTSYIIHHMFSTKMFFSRPMQSILRWPTSMFQCLVEQTIIIMPMLNSFWILLRESLYRWAEVSKMFISNLEIPASGDLELNMENVSFVVPPPLLKSTHSSPEHNFFYLHMTQCPNQSVVVAQDIRKS